MRTTNPIDLVYFHEGLPPCGAKFVAFYGDGSGASILKRWEDGRFYWAVDEEANEMERHDFMEAGFLSWALLPDDFEIWEPS